MPKRKKKSFFPLEWFHFYTCVKAEVREVAKDVPTAISVLDRLWAAPLPGLSKQAGAGQAVHLNVVCSG